MKFKLQLRRCRFWTSSLLDLFTYMSAIIPKSEIQKANLRQFTACKLFGKISPDPFWHGFDFSKKFTLQHLAAS